MKQERNGPIGSISQALEYPFNKGAQKLLQAKNRVDKHNRAVAIERSSDFYGKNYSGDLTGYRIERLSQGMSSVNKESATSSNPPVTVADSDNSTSPLSPAGKKQQASHVTP